MQINQKSDATGIQVFNSTMFGEIRTIIKDDGECFFVASDVAKALGYAVPQKAVLDHCKHCSKMEHPYNKGTYMNIIPESDMYRLTMKSKLPNAELFQDWVCEEVIPAIRKTGGYIATHQDDTPEEIMARALTIAQATLSKREERLKQLETQTEQQQATIKIQTEEIKQAAPKVSYYDNHLQSVNTLTSTQVAKQIGMDAEKLHRKMKEIGILYKQSGQWLLYSPFSTWGLHATRTQTYTRNDGSIGTSVYTVWTTKGIRFIHALNECGWNVKKAIKQIKGEFEPAA